MSAQHRSALAALLRPRLKPPGFNDQAFLRQFDALLDAAGVAKDDVPVAPAPVIHPKPAEAALVGPLSPAQAQIDAALLRIACPQNSLAELALWVEPTRSACVRWGIDTIREVASFLANISVESAGLTRLTENLNYSAEALVAKFGRHRISIADAYRYGRTKDHPANQEALANILYGGEWGRKNLGNIHPGDGWKYRGYGPKQITGRANQSAFATAMCIPLEEVPAYVRTRYGGMMSAGWFWKTNDLDEKAATPGVADDRRAINGGSFGLGEVEGIFDALIEEMLRRERRIAA